MASKSHTFNENIVLAVGVSIGVLYWLMDAVADGVFRGGGLVSQMQSIGPVEAWMRMMALTLFVAFSIYIKNILSRLWRVKTELLEERNKLVNVLDNMSDAISIQDGEFRITYQNKAFVGLAGDCVGRYCYEAYENRGRVCEGCPVSAAFMDGCTHTSERTMNRDGGDLHLQLIASPLKDLSGRASEVIVTAHDVTDEKLSERTLRRRLAMETAISDVSRTLLTKTGGDIADVLKVLGESADADHSFVYLLDDVQRRLSTLYEWTAPGAGDPDNDSLKEIDLSELGGWMDRLRSGEAINIPDVSGLKGDRLGELCLGMGVKSILMVPLMRSGGGPAGVIGFDDYRVARDWSPEEVRLIRLSAGILAAHIERITAEEQLKEHEARLEHMAHHDPLTGLPNRLLFADRLDVALAHAHRHRECVAVMFLDLDRFKSVNDEFGHSAGDSLLVDVSRRIFGCLRECDTVARLGGDEFGMVVPDIMGGGDAVAIADRVLGSLREPFCVEGRQVPSTASIGIAIYPADGEDAETLLKKADKALYLSKDQGRDQAVLCGRDTPPGSFPL